MIPDGVVTWAEIDLDAIAANVAGIKAFVGPSVDVIASVKANAYGHGLLPGGPHSPGCRRDVAGRAPHPGRHRPP